MIVSDLKKFLMHYWMKPSSEGVVFSFSLPTVITVNVVLIRDTRCEVFLDGGANVVGQIQD